MGASPTAATGTANKELAWLLDDLIARVPGTQHSLVLSNDGLLVAVSTRPTRDQAEQLAAIASGLQSLARSTGRYLNAGDVRQTIVELEQAYLVVTAAGPGACLAVLANPDADLGLVAYEMAKLVTGLGTYLSTPSRAQATPTGSPAS